MDKVRIDENFSKNRIEWGATLKKLVIQYWGIPLAVFGLIFIAISATAAMNFWSNWSAKTEGNQDGTSASGYRPMPEPIVIARYIQGLTDTINLWNDVEFTSNTSIGASDHSASIQNLIDQFADEKGFLDSTRFPKNVVDSITALLDSIRNRNQEGHDFSSLINSLMSHGSGASGSGGGAHLKYFRIPDPAPEINDTEKPDNPQVVPLPGAFLLLGSGLICLAALKRKF